jgi:transposase-like protein
VSRATYNEREKATVFAYLTANGGNIKRTARETNIPISTVRDWKTTWEKEGVPEDVQNALPSIADEIVDEFTRVRNKGLVELERQLDDGQVKGAALVAAIGMLTDKIRLFRGEATSRTESRQALPEPQQLRELVATFFEEAVNSAQVRAELIDDGEWEPARVRALPSPEEVNA